jgi:uroporphyrin-III C-methyltransferase
MEGTTENQRVIKGTLGDIVEKAKKEGAKPPGVIVVGDVVNVLEN